MPVLFPHPALLVTVKLRPLELVTPPTPTLAPYLDPQTDREAQQYPPSRADTNTPTRNLLASKTHLNRRPITHRARKCLTQQCWYKGITAYLKNQIILYNTATVCLQKQFLTHCPLSDTNLRSLGATPAISLHMGAEFSWWCIVSARNSPASHLVCHGRLSNGALWYVSLPTEASRVTGSVVGCGSAEPGPSRRTPKTSLM